MKPNIRTDKTQRQFTQEGETDLTFSSETLFSSSETFSGIDELPNKNINAPIIKSLN